MMFHKTIAVMFHRTFAVMFHKTIAVMLHKTIAVMFHKTFAVVFHKTFAVILVGHRTLQTDASADITWTTHPNYIDNRFTFKQRDDDSNCGDDV